MNHHRLIVHSLRPARASCTCGHWEYTGTTTDYETNQEIRQQIGEQFDQHIHRLCLQCRKPVSTEP